MGVYTGKIWIGCENDGQPLVGAYQGANDAASCEQVWPSQMRYRCTARKADGTATVCTPTEAKREGWKVLFRFPPADGRFSRR